MADRHDGIADRLRVLCGRLLLASVVAGFKTPTHVLAHTMKRMGWEGTLRDTNMAAYAALMGMIKALEEQAKRGTADTAKQIAFINTYPWFGGEPSDGVEN